MAVQLGLELTDSPPLAVQECVQIKSRLALQHVVDRPGQFMSQDGQGFALAMFFLQVGSSNFCPAGLSRRNKTAASEKAHLRWALPILVPEVPERFPADSLAHLTRRQ